jgi:ribosomal protein S18 acetylase RimI-like enzyme
MIAATIRPKAHGLQTFDPYRHLAQVADLVGLTFGGELGPGARLVLRRMRRMARWGGVGLWLAGVEAAWNSPGFVWIEDGRVVGNVSLRHAAARGGWMIGNVAVHPSWQGRGIGRELMEAAVDTVAERGGSWVGLEVREDNVVARGLYERIGFQPVGRLVELSRPAGTTWGDIPATSISLRKARVEDSEALYRLAKAGLTNVQCEVLEIRRSAHRVGLESRLGNLLEGCRDSQWVAEREGQIAGALRIRSRWPARWHVMEVLIDRDYVETLAPRLVTTGVLALSRRRPWEVTTTLTGVRSSLEPLFLSVGFKLARRLLEMRLSLGPRRRVLE